MKKRFILLTAAMAVCLITASCSKSSDPRNETRTAQSTNAMMEMEDKDFSGEAGGALMPEGQKATALSVSERKMVYEAFVRLEALDIKQAIDIMTSLLEENGGFVANESIQGNVDSKYRSASYTLRVPQKNYNTFLQELNNVGNVTSQSQNAEDITADYIDTEARLKSLRIQEERLLDMMSKAGELETLLAIQNQLAEVTYNIESYMSQKNTYDNLLAYSTVTLDIQQVYKTGENKASFSSRFNVALVESWHGFVGACQSFAIGLIYALPEILVLALIGVITLIIVKAILKKRNAAIKPITPEHMPAQNKTEE